MTTTTRTPRTTYGVHSKPARTTYGVAGQVEYVHSAECLAQAKCKCGQTCRGGFGLAEATHLERLRKALLDELAVRPTARGADLVAAIKAKGSIIAPGYPVTVRDVHQLLTHETERRGGARPSRHERSASEAAEAARDLLRAGDMTQVEIARTVGLSHQRISQLWRGLRAAQEGEPQ
jgi:hypothetical protein